MNKKSIIGITLTGLLLAGCGTEAERVTQNLAQESDNFNTVRKVTVINAIKNDIIFQMSGRMSIKADRKDHQIEILKEEILKLNNEIVNRGIESEIAISGKVIEILENTVIDDWRINNNV